MIVVILTAVFLCAFYAQGKIINCYRCHEGLTPETGLKSLDSRVAKNITECTDPIENSKTIAVNSNQYVCMKFVIKGSYLLHDIKYAADAILRGAMGKGRCDALLKPLALCKLLNLGVTEHKDLSMICYECNTNKCNSASSVEISPLVFLALVVSYFMLS